MLRFEEARARVLEWVTALPMETVSVAACVGRVLAVDHTAAHDLPPFSYSAMDGYAVATADLDGRTATLPVATERRAGDGPGRALAVGTAARIFTGAPLPPRADAVVMQEETTREGDAVTLGVVPKPGSHVRKQGEDLRKGAVALCAGTRVTPWQVALLASCDRATVAVVRRPRVAVVLTGDELRAPGSAARAGSVVDAIGPSLVALVGSLGGEARVVGPVVDTMEAVRGAMRDALSDSDVVLTVGGVSVGDHDLVKPALAEEGVTLDFWKVAIKPGKPLCFGQSKSGVRVLGLPGNPASALLTFSLFGAPLLRALGGERQLFPALESVTIAHDWKRSAGRKEFVRVRWKESGVVEVLPNQASGAATSFAWADALMVVDAETASVKAGDRVEVMRL